MALSAVKNTLERALDKDLSDLVRGIRAHKYDEVCNEVRYSYPQAKYINECIDEIKNELKTGNIVSKANAVNKLAYVRIGSGLIFSSKCLDMTFPGLPLT